MKNNTASAAGGAMPAEGQKPETYAASFLRLLALRQSIEQTLAAMAALLDDEPEGVPIPVRALVRSHQRREA